MSAYHNNINIGAYKKSFANVDGLNQIIMLYDGAVASLQQAKQAIIDKKIEERFNSISKTFKILTGLHDSLDHANGGEVAAVLSEWYTGTIYRVLNVGQTQSLEMCELCITHIKQMRDAWVEIEHKLKSGEASSEPENSTQESDNTPGNKNDFFETIAKAAISGSGMNISI